MRSLVILSALALGLIVIISCQREYSLENAVTGISAGTLKTVAGDCLPSGSEGPFKKSIPLDSSSYIFVDIDVYRTGSYKVSSDTVNGISFKCEGFFESPGVHTIRLYAYGRPFTNGTVPYAVKYGNQKCIVNVFVAE